ncbi:MAG: hypothetical protein J3K34DRAFT_493087 [Monoraphidium minutum]|nr:MAG: hypothetical protein J3K34DRAFT_493087 [Monoraphidium minutum]
MLRAALWTRARRAAACAAAPPPAAPAPRGARGRSALTGDDVAGSVPPTPALSFAEVGSMLKALVGPLSWGDLVFGVSALARRHREAGLAYEVAGARPAVADRGLVADLLSAADMAYGCYKSNAQSLCAVSSLKLPHVHKFVPDNARLRPAYFIAADHDAGRIVWGVRGTKSLHDALTDAMGAACQVAPGRFAHDGMLQAARELIRLELPEVLRLSAQHPGYEIRLVGHSLGGGVAALLTHTLLTTPPLRAAALRHARAVSCVAIAPPAAACAGLADEMRPHVTSVVREHDIVPHCSLGQVAALRDEVLAVDWYTELKSSVFEMAYVRAVSDAVASAGALPAAASSGAAQAQRLAAELLSSRYRRQIAAALGMADAGAGAGAGGAGRQPQQQGQQQQQQGEQRQQQLGQQRQQGQQRQGEGEHAAEGGAPPPGGAAAWQAAVVERWVADLSRRLVPYLGSLPEAVSDKDLRRAADAAVGSLAAALSGWSALLPAVPALPQLPALPRLPLPGLPFGAPPAAPTPAPHSTPRGGRAGGGAGASAAAQGVDGGLGDLVSLARWRDSLDDWWGGAGAAAPPAAAGAAAAAAAAGARTALRAGGGGGGAAASEGGRRHMRLYPPGRVLFLRTADDNGPCGRRGGRAGAGGGAPAGAGAGGASAGGGGSGAASGGGSGAASGAAGGVVGGVVGGASRHGGRMELIDLAPSDLASPGWDRVLLHERMLADHRTRAYRAALLRVLRALPPGGARE